jgi:hypothetical protein
MQNVVFTKKKMLYKSDNIPKTDLVLNIPIKFLVRRIFFVLRFRQKRERRRFKYYNKQYLPGIRDFYKLMLIKIYLHYRFFYNSFFYKTSYNKILINTSISI